MAHLLDIKDHADAGYMKVQLKEVLGSVQPEGQHLHWSLLDIWAMGRLSGGRTYLELEHVVRQAPFGLALSWEELWQLGQELEDVYDIYILGHTGGVKAKRWEGDHNTYSKSSMVLELFDSSYWRIYSEDEAVIARLQRDFSETSVQDGLLNG